MIIFNNMLVFWSLLGIAIGIISYIPYFKTMLSGKTKPHAFSWFIWAFLTATAFFAQYTSGAGPGAWVTGFTAFLCFFIFVFALFKGEKERTKSDWMTFTMALATIPVWLVTNDPLYAVILITIIDALGFYPTLRKTWFKPQEEALLTYGLSAVKFFVAILALQTINWTTALYPLSLVIMNAGFVIMALYRRKKI